MSVKYNTWKVMKHEVGFAMYLNFFSFFIEEPFKLVDKLFWYNMNLWILLKHFGIWKSEVMYERDKSDKFLLVKIFVLWISNQA